MASDSTPPAPRADGSDVRAGRTSALAAARRPARPRLTGIVLLVAGALGVTAIATASSSQEASWAAATAPAARAEPLCGDVWEGADFQVGLALHVRNDTDDPVRVVSARVVDAENLTVHSLGMDDPWLEAGGLLEPVGRGTDDASAHAPEPDPADGGVVGSPGPLGPMHVSIAAGTEGAPAFRLLRSPALTVIPAHGSVTLVADAALTDPDRPGSVGGLELGLRRDGGREVVRSTVPMVVARDGVPLPAACGS